MQQMLTQVARVLDQAGNLGAGQPKEGVITHDRARAVNNSGGILAYRLLLIASFLPSYICGAYFS